MYPVLPFGPFTIPTTPIVILVATTVGLEIAGRYGRRVGIAIDDIWNIGLLTILIGLIVARLWNVIQFWPIYVAEPRLIISIRPSGFVVWPGFTAGILTIFGYLLRRALHPLPVLAALLIGAATAMAIIQAGQLLSGDLLGTQSSLPWAIPYYGELRHPVALYYGGGLALWVCFILSLPTTNGAARIILYLLLGGGIVYLLGGAFEYNAPIWAGLHIKQLIGLSLSLLASLQLARSTITREALGEE